MRIDSGCCGSAVLSEARGTLDEPTDLSALAPESRDLTWSESAGETCGAPDVSRAVRVECQLAPRAATPALQVEPRAHIPTTSARRKHPYTAGRAAASSGRRPALPARGGDRGRRQPQEAGGCSVPDGVRLTQAVHSSAVVPSARRPAGALQPPVLIVDGAAAARDLHRGSRKG